MMQREVLISVTRTNNHQVTLQLQYSRYKDDKERCGTQKSITPLEHIRQYSDRVELALQSTGFKFG